MSHALQHLLQSAAFQEPREERWIADRWSSQRVSGNDIWSLLQHVDHSAATDVAYTFNFHCDAIWPRLRVCRLRHVSGDESRQCSLACQTGLALPILHFMFTRRVYTETHTKEANTVGPMLSLTYCPHMSGCRQHCKWPYGSKCRRSSGRRSSCARSRTRRSCSVSKGRDGGPSETRTQQLVRHRLLLN